MKNIKIISVIVITSAFVGMLEGAKIRFSDPNIPNGEMTTYRVTEGRNISESTYNIERKQNDGKWIYAIRYVIRSTPHEMIIHAEDMKPISIKKFNPQGELEFSIAYSSDRVHFIYPGPKRNEVKEVPDDSYDVNTMMQVLRGFPFGKEEKVDFTLVTEDHVIGVYAKSIGMENVTTPLGPINCYKLEAGVSGFKGKIITYKFYFWYGSDSPHRLIKYYDTKDQTTILMIK